MSVFSFLAKLSPSWVSFLLLDPFLAALLKVKNCLWGVGFWRSRFCTPCPPWQHHSCWFHSLDSWTSLVLPKNTLAQPQKVKVLLFCQRGVSSLLSKSGFAQKRKSKAQITYHETCTTGPWGTPHSLGVPHTALGYPTKPWGTPTQSWGTPTEL